MLVLTEWEEFKDLDLGLIDKLLHYPIVIDGRNLFSTDAMREHGFIYLSMGRPDVVPERRAAADKRSDANPSAAMKTMRVLVTGGAGFLGSHLCDLLLAHGHSVLAVDNLLTGSMHNLKHLAHEPRFSLELHDICEPFDYGRVDYVFDFASPASPVDYMKYAIETLKVGSVGTMNSLEVARRYNASFLLASTSECYGDPLEHPQRESYWGNVNPIGPRSVYDESKRFAEAVTMAYHRYHGLNTHIARIFNTYGPRLKLNDGRVISNLMKQALMGEPLTVYGDGTQTRSFCYVSDELEGILRLALSEEHSPTNIGNPAEFTVLDCVRRVLAVTGSSSRIVFEPLPEDDPQQRRPDICKAMALLGTNNRSGDRTQAFSAVLPGMCGAGTGNGRRQLAAATCGIRSDLGGQDTRGSWMGGLKLPYLKRPTGNLRLWLSTVLRKPPIRGLQPVLGCRRFYNGQSTPKPQSSKMMRSGRQSFQRRARTSPTRMDANTIRIKSERVGSATFSITLRIAISGSITGGFTARLRGSRTPTAGFLSSISHAMP